LKIIGQPKILFKASTHQTTRKQSQLCNISGRTRNRQMAQGRLNEKEPKLESKSSM